MAEFNLGQVAFFDKGLFSLSETYTKWDFVTTTDSTYLCVSDTPIIGKEVTNTTYWKCIADGKPATLAASLAVEKAGYAQEQGDYAKGIGDSYDAVKLDKTAVDIYNVTLAVPLPAGSYYNSTSARAAVPVAVRKKGLELIYETSAGIWYKERYVGVDVANWTVASNWEIVPLKSHIENNEEVIAEALVELKNKIDALQNIIKEMILGSVQIDNLDIVKNLNLYGSSNMILTGTAAPAVVPDFIGQFFIKTSATTACYQATGNSSVNDWKQIG